MIKIYVKKQSNYPVKSTDIKKHLNKFFKKKGLVSDSVVSVAIVGQKKMLDISRQYLKDNKMHSILSFTSNETKKDFIYPPGDYIFLGEIILCFPKLFEEAKKEGKRLDDKVKQLLEHGALHLLGIHHGS